jgi:hypothetical protein
MKELLKLRDLVLLLLKNRKSDYVNKALSFGP